MADENSDLTLRILREIQATLGQHDRRFDKIELRFDGIERRLDTIEVKIARVEVDTRDLRAIANRHSVLFDALIESIAQLRAGRTVSDVAIRHHDAELTELRERLSRLEEKS